MNLATHPLFTMLRDVKGNARGCILTEPLWGIPFFLYAPYVSVYMLALGVKDSQIGLIVSIGMVLSIISALLSGAITDKLGRKRTTYLFDLFSWSIPCLIWAVAQNFNYFLIAAVVNSVWRVTHNSWSCLLVEDTDPETLVDVYTWIYVAGLLAAFFAPLASILINQFSLVPTVRGLYIFAFAMMTFKFVIMNGMVTETKQGLIRMEQTKNQSLFSLLSGYKGIFREILHTPQTLFTLGVYAGDEHLRDDQQHLLVNLCDRENQYPAAAPGPLSLYALDHHAVFLLSGHAQDPEYELPQPHAGWAGRLYRQPGDLNRQPRKRLPGSVGQHIDRSRQLCHGQHPARQDGGRHG